jgi:hypothetical protein
MLGFFPFWILSRVMLNKNRILKHMAVKTSKFQNGISRLAQQQNKKILRFLTYSHPGI